MTNEEFYQNYCMWCGTQRCPGDEEAFQTCGYYRKEVLHLEPPRNPCLDCSTDIYYCNRKQCSSYRAYVLDCIDGGYGLPH